MGFESSASGPPQPIPGQSHDAPSASGPSWPSRQELTPRSGDKVRASHPRFTASVAALPQRFPRSGRMAVPSIKRCHPLRQRFLFDVRQRRRRVVRPPLQASGQTACDIRGAGPPRVEQADCVARAIVRIPPIVRPAGYPTTAVQRRGCHFWRCQAMAKPLRASTRRQSRLLSTNGISKLPLALGLSWAQSKGSARRVPKGAAALFKQLLRALFAEPGRRLRRRAVARVSWSRRGSGLEGVAARRASPMRSP